MSRPDVLKVMAVYFNAVTGGQELGVSTGAAYIQKYLPRYYIVGTFSAPG